MTTALQRNSLGVAVIGAGRIGTMRARLAAQHPAVNFIAVSDLHRDAAQALADRASAQFVAASNREAIEHPSVNTVIVSTSEHEHTEAVVMALALGKKVMVEKPIALKLEDADRILRALDKSTGSLHVGYSRRFKDRYLIAKEQILQGRIGKIVGGAARVFNSRSQALAMMKRNPEATPVVDALTYYVDLMNWLLEGNPAVEVFARGQGSVLKETGFNTNDVTWAIVTFADGTVVHPLDEGYVRRLVAELRDTPAVKA